MTIEEAQQRMDSDKPVKYRGHLYTVLGINKLNNMVTIAQGPIGKDVKASELDER